MTEAGDSSLSGSGPEEIAAAITALRSGALVAFPTETVYGLGADATRADAVARVYALKGRPANNPLIVHVSSEDMARACAAHWPDAASRLASAFWPGPLTIVVPRSAGIPAIVTAGGPNVALRCPAHPLTLALIEACGFPLVGPSANPSGFVSPTTAAHVREAFPDLLVLDGGPCSGGIESTVISLEPAPRILRAGLIGPTEIERVLAEPVTAAQPAPSSAGPLESPGLLERHYSPRTRCIVRDASDRTAPPDPATITIAIAPAREDSHTIVLPADARGYAAGLYAALREADARAGKLIVIHRPPSTGPEAEVWRAIHDRINRAAAEARSKPHPASPDSRDLQA